MGEVKTLTPRDIRDAENGLDTDGLLDPFVTGDSDDQKDRSREELKRGIGSHLRYLDTQDEGTRIAALDTPLVSTPEEEEEEEEDTDTQPGDPENPDVVAQQGQGGGGIRGRFGRGEPGEGQ